MRILTGWRASVPAAVTAALLITGCGGARAGTGAGTSPVPVGGLAPRTASAGPVAVTVDPQRIDGSGATFKVELSNHEIDLTGDYAATSTLSVAGTPWAGPRWSGDGPGGHHRTGTLSFTAAGRAAGPAELRLGGLPAPVTVQWTLPDN